MDNRFEIFPIGFVHKKDDMTWIEIDDRYSDALLGLDGFSHIYVFYWFHKNDSSEKRNVLQVHPRKDKRNPLTGVFATHSPMRPNLIALTLCKILDIDGTTIRIEEIDAIDGSPVIDIKCYIPSTHALTDLRLPNWV